MLEMLDFGHNFGIEKRKKGGHFFGINQNLCKNQPATLKGGEELGSPPPRKGGALFRIHTYSPFAPLLLLASRDGGV